MPILKQIARYAGMMNAIGSMKPQIAQIDADFGMDKAFLFLRASAAICGFSYLPAE